MNRNNDLLSATDLEFKSTSYRPESSISALQIEGQLEQVLDGLSRIGRTFTRGHLIFNQCFTGKDAIESTMQLCGSTATARLLCGMLMVRRHATRRLLVPAFNMWTAIQNSLNSHTVKKMIEDCDEKNENCQKSAPEALAVDNVFRDTENDVYWIAKLDRESMRGEEIQSEDEDNDEHQNERLYQFQHHVHFDRIEDVIKMLRFCADEQGISSGVSIVQQLQESGQVTTYDDAILGALLLVHQGALINDEMPSSNEFICSCNVSYRIHRTDKNDDTTYQTEEMKKSSTYDLLVVGAGAAGVEAAKCAAYSGVTVALASMYFSDGRISTRCLPGDDIDDMPSHYDASIVCGVLAAAVDSLHHAKTWQPRSVQSDLRESIRLLSHILKQVKIKNANLSKIRTAKYLARHPRIHVFEGKIRFASPTTAVVSMNDRNQANVNITFKNVILAPGSQYQLPMKISRQNVWAPATLYSNLMWLNKQQRRRYTDEMQLEENQTEYVPIIVILGANGLACRLSQSFARLGIFRQVHIVTERDRILNDDTKVAAVIAHALTQDGVNIWTNTIVESTELTGNENELHPLRVTLVKNIGAGGDPVSSTLEVDIMLYCNGNRANVQGMGLEHAGIGYDLETGIHVDQQLRSLTCPHAYAIGNACNQFRFGHEAESTARFAVRNALFNAQESFVHALIPKVVDTDPPIVHLGPSINELKQHDIRYDSVSMRLDSIEDPGSESCIDARSNSTNTTAAQDNKPFMTIRTRFGTDEILSATMVGKGALEVMPMVSLAMLEGNGLSLLSHVIIPWQSRSRIIKSCADKWHTLNTKESIQKLLSKSSQ